MATSYLSPGVYVEEVDRGSKPIEAVGTNTVGFLGESMMGPANQAVLIVNWSQFVKTFGDFTQSTHLAHAVYGFFNNGGSRCFVVNVGAPSSLEIEQAAAAPGPAKEGEKKPDQAKPVEKKQGGGNTDGLYIGKDGGPGARTGLKCFEEIDEISLVAAPGQTSPAVQDALLTHCETRKDRFALLDSPEVMSGGVDKLPRPRDSKYGAYYFP
ncbi:MAG TPA: phage tail sheath family protein, partial [Polyangia bacterium]|nr:phage tail sheath family protein [Polyangia bacterium]